MPAMVTIATFHSQPEAEAVRLLLAHEGIEAILLDETTVAMDWLLMNAIGGIKLQVQPQDAERAANIIESHQAERKQRLLAQATKFVRFNCTECGALQQFTSDRRGRVEECTKCGNYVDVPELSDDLLVEQHLTVDAVQDTDNPSCIQRKIPLRMEVACVLAFAYVPLLINALPIWGGAEQSVGTGGNMLQLIGLMFSVVPPLLFIIAVSNEPWSKFGIQRPRWIADFFLAVGLWFAANCAMIMTLGLLQMSEMTDTAMMAISGNATEFSTGSIEWSTLVLCIVGLVANSITEELTMRGYLIPRLEELFKSRIYAVGISAAMFASYHMYQGLPNTIAIFALALVYGAFFCVFRRLWPLVLAHTFSNLTIYLSMYYPS